MAEHVCKSVCVCVVTCRPGAKGRGQGEYIAKNSVSCKAITGPASGRAGGVANGQFTL